MQLREVMSPDVEVVRADVTLQEAAQRMKARHSGYVLVREGEQSLGIATDRDLTVRLVAEGRGRDPQAVVAILPSDHFILEEEPFMASVEHTAAFVNGHPEHPVLLGVEPRRPEVELGNEGPLQSHV